MTQFITKISIIHTTINWPSYIHSPPRPYIKSQPLYHIWSIDMTQCFHDRGILLCHMYQFFLWYSISIVTWILLSRNIHTFPSDGRASFHKQMTSNYIDLVSKAAAVFGYASQFVVSRIWWAHFQYQAWLLLLTLMLVGFSWSNFTSWLPSFWSVVSCHLLSIIFFSWIIGVRNIPYHSQIIGPASCIGPIPFFGNIFGQRPRPKRPLLLAGCCWSGTLIDLSIHCRWKDERSISVAALCIAIFSQDTMAAVVIGSLLDLLASYVVLHIKCTS